MSTERALHIFAALSDIDEDIILETCPPASASSAARPREEGRLGRFLSNGVAAAVLSVIASVSLIVAIVLAGRWGEDPVPMPPGGTNTPESDSVTAPVVPPESDTEFHGDTETAVETAAGTGRPSESEPLTEAGTEAETDPPPPPSEGLEFASNGDGTCTLLGLGTCRDTALVVPAQSPDGDRVTLIRESAFSENTTVRSVILPDSVERIGSYAFAGCTALRSVELGDGVKTVDACAFGGCPSLRTVTGGAALRSILWEAFKDCTALEDFPLPDKLDLIDTRAFYGCTSLTEVTVPAAVRVVTSEAFRACTSLEDIVFAPGCKALIQPYAFADCPRVRSITLPGTLSRIQNNAFPEKQFAELFITDLAGWCNVTLDYACSNPMPFAAEVYFDGIPARDLVIPEGVRRIGTYAFYGCGTLTSVTLADSVRTISSYAFAGCSKLTDITFGSSLSSVGLCAFELCGSLSRLHIRDMAAFASLHFGETDRNPLYRGADLYMNGEPVRDLVIPDGVTVIGKGAFVECRTLVSVTLPDSLQSIGERAFEGCASLSEIVYPGSRKEWEALEKGTAWDDGMPVSYVVRCTDGNLVVTA